MAAMHEDARRRGEALAGLEASESIIYGRFGYGLAADMVEYSIDSRDSAFAVPAPSLDLALVDGDEAVALLPGIFDRQRRTRAGEINRSPAFWNEHLADPQHRRAGRSALFHAACDGGYVSYRAGHESSVFRGERATVTVEELRGDTAEIEAGLWRFVLDLDLVGTVAVLRRPVDEPVRWRLSDPRRLRTEAVEDRLYVRILDPGAAFVARGYQGEGRLVLDVLAPQVSEGADDGAPGRWVVEAGPDGATCSRAHAGDSVDLRLGVPALGSLYMGGFAASLLADGGLIEEVRPGSLAVADALFTTRPAPRSGTGF